MPILIREGTENDSEDLAFIGACTFALACPPNTPKEDLESYVKSELTSEKFKKYINDRKAILHVAEVTGKVVGYCMLYLSEVPDEVQLSDSIEMKRLYVIPEFHGTEVAPQLMLNAIKLATDRGYRQIWLSVSRENQRAISFYQKTGFVKVGEQKFYVGNDIHQDNIMVNILTAA